MLNLKNNSDNPNKLYFWIGFSPFFLSVITALTIVTALRFLPPELPLFYSVAWGNGQLATHQQFLIIPASITFITTLNLVIFWHLHPSQSFLKKVLSISSVLLSLILTVSLIKIILVFI